MDFDIKRFLLALLLCMLVMMLWMKYINKSPETTNDQTSSTGQDDNQTAQTSPVTVQPTDPNVRVSDPQLWQLKKLTTTSEDVILGDREQVEYQKRFFAHPQRQG